MTDSTEIRPTLKGVVDENYGGKVIQYRGIQYATIKKRFAKPVLNTAWQKTTDCTKFGPRCPQAPNDVRELLQIPRDLATWPKDKEDELKCANLTISCPSDTSSTKQKLPVIIWIYGGSQMTSFGSSSQRLGNTNPLIAHSIEMGKPVIVVAIHYRLNVFAFGDREGELNLDLQDQRVAIDWVKRYISGFGGDTENITLAGESAGGIYVHALLASGVEVARAILHSGCLFTTPPQPDKRGLGLLGLMEGNLQIIEMEHGNMNPGESTKATLAGAPVDRLVSTVRDLQVTSKWTWEDKSTNKWQDVEKVFGKLKGLMIGDCEAEAFIYQRLINNLTGTNILKVFEATSADAGKKVAEAYGVTASDTAASRRAAIQFISDARFNWPTLDITQQLSKTGKSVHRFVFDQVNPFAKKDAIAHHAVDLLAVFGGYDDVVGDEMRKVGHSMRSNWISFANGEQPWSAGKVFAYGPDGKTGELSTEEAASRRRENRFEVLREVGLDTYQALWWALLSAGASAGES